MDPHFPPTPDVQDGDFHQFQFHGPSSSGSQAEDLGSLVGRLAEAATNYQQRQPAAEHVHLFSIRHGDFEELVRDDEDEEETAESWMEDEEEIAENWVEDIIEISDDDTIQASPEPMQNQQGNEDFAEQVEFEIHVDPEVEMENFMEAEPQVAVYLWARDIMVLNPKPNYTCISMCRNQPEAAKIRPGIFPTNWIPRDSLYWAQYLIQLQHKVRVQERSVYDNEMVSAYKYPNGRVKISRNYVNVILNHGKQKLLKKAANIFWQDEERVKQGIYPTDLIPPDSPYYLEPLQDLFFPKINPAWVRKTGVDGIELKFRLGAQGKNVYVKRNGITVQLYPIH